MPQWVERIVHSPTKLLTGRMHFDYQKIPQAFQGGSASVALQDAMWKILAAPGR